MMTAKDIKDQLWTELELDGRSITFHIVDGFSFGSGIVESKYDLSESDALYPLCDDDQKSVFVDNVTSYMLGNGESDHAGIDDIDVLNELRVRYPGPFFHMLDDCADVLASVDDVRIQNPYFHGSDYDDPYDDYDDD